MRRKAAEALGQIGPDAKSAVPALTSALTGGMKKDMNDAEVRTAAAVALGGIGPDAKSALPTLTAIAEAKKGKDKTFKKAVADAIKKIQDSK